MKTQFLLSLTLTTTLLTATAGELLQDPGFEQQDKAWHVWGTWGGFTAADKQTLQQYDTEAPHGGSSCLKVTDVRDDKAPYIIQFIDKVEGGQQYILTFWAKGKNGTKARAGMQMTGAGKYLGGSLEPVELTEKWTKYTVIIPTTSKKTDRLGLVLAATSGDKTETGSAWFDDIELKQATAEDVAATLKAMLGKPKQDGLIFHASMDGKADADFAIAGTKPTRAKKLTFVQGKIGKAVHIADDAQLYYDGRNLSLEEGTVAMWIKRSARWSEKRSYTLFRATVGPAWNQNSLSLIVTKWNQLRAWVWNADKKQWLIMSPNGIEQAADTWYHVAVTFQEGDVNVYINGKEISYGTPCDPMCEMPYGTAKNLEIGSGYSNKSVLNGDVDDLRVYNRPLSATEISKLATVQ